jgi:hypothetical protein
MCRNISASSTPISSNFVSSIQASNLKPVCFSHPPPLACNLQEFKESLLFLLGDSPASELYMPKRRHIKFIRRGITQKKEYNIQNTAKVGNQDYKENLHLFC